MKKMKFTILSILTALLFCAGSVWAGDYKVYGSHYAWNNNWYNNSAISASFGTGSTPEMTVSYNFSSGNLYGYPAICRGWHYGWNPANDYLFPMKLSDASSIPCTFSWNAGGSNMTGDFAYDMFLRWDNASGSNNPQLEVMVWGDNNSWPIGNLTASNVVTQGGITFDLWEGMNDAAGYYVYTFIPHQRWGDGYSITQSGSLNVDMKLFFNWLQNNRSGDGRYNNSMYLHVIEAGIEITGGNGWAYITANINAYTGGNSGSTYYNIKARNSGKLLDVSGASQDDNAAIVQYSSTNGTNQQFEMVDAGSGYVYLKARHSGKAIRASNGKAVQYTLNSGYWSEMFQRISTGNGYYLLKNRNTGTCLRVENSSTSNLANIVLDACNSSYYSEQFYFSQLNSVSKEEVVTSANVETNSPINFYPNPLTDGNLNIDLSGTTGISMIKLIDLSGKVLKQINSSDQSVVQMNIDAKPGIYMIQVTNNDKNITEKLIIK